MFKAIKEFFTGKPAVVETPAEAPYKVPEPAATTPIPLVVETAPSPVEAAPVAATTPATKKAPAKKQQFDKKPAVKAKTSRPRKPKAKPAVAK
jgi:hypothetical protein